MPPVASDQCWKQVTRYYQANCSDRGGKLVNKSEVVMKLCYKASIAKSAEEKSEQASLAKEIEQLQERHTKHLEEKFGAKRRKVEDATEAQTSKEALDQLAAQMVQNAEADSQVSQQGLLQL